jgi:S1-C subfamily serine protease
LIDAQSEDPFMSATIVDQGENILSTLSNELASAVASAGESTVTVNGRRRMPASGIVWAAGGVVVTANHVVERNEDITIASPDGRTLKADLVGRDPGSDLALLKVEADGLVPATKATQPAKPGHLVLAVGRPGPSGPMASLGVVSLVGGSWRTPEGGSIEGFIRSDAAMLPGFSGGPLVDVSGSILGLNSSTLGRQGGLTLPVTTIDRVVDAIQKHGKVRRGFLGISAQAVAVNQRLAEELGLSQNRGLVVVGLEPDGPGEKQGLLIGDVIVEVGGTPVASVEELQDRLSGDVVGTEIEVRLVRGGALTNKSIVVGERS